MKNVLLIPALMISSAAFALDEGQDMTTSVHGGGSNLFPHFNTQYGASTFVSSRLIAKTSLFYDGSKFVPIDSVDYTFNYSAGRGGYTTPDAPNNDERVFFDESYSFKYDKLGGYYIPVLHRSQAYNAGDQVTELTYQLWNANNMVWKDSSRYYYDYANGLMSTSILQLYIGGWTQHGAPSTMQYSSTNKMTELNANYYKMEFVYNAADQLVQTVDKELVNGIWNYDEKNTYTYNGNNLQTHVKELYDVQANKWVKASSLEYTYDITGKVISVTEKIWDGNSFINKQKNEYTYDVNDNKETDILSEWDGSSFQMKTKENLEYNNSRQVTLITTQTWTGSAWAYTMADQQIRFYYQVYFPASVNNVAAAKGAIKAYPIPAADNLTVSLKMDKSQDLSFAIVDMKGSIVKTWNDHASSNYQQTISVAELPAGNYFIRANGDEAVYTERFIVAR